VQEYWLVNPETATIEQYPLREGRYDLRLKSGSGEVTCTAIPGLVRPVRACFDRAANLDCLRTLMQR
jgi:hypothetical protein